MSKSSSIRTPEASSPSRLGYRMPAEWEPHQGTWLSWPHNRATWPCPIERIEAFYVQLILAMARDEAVFINVHDAAMEAAVRKRLTPSLLDHPVQFFHHPTNDAWCRDYGLIVVRLLLGGKRYPPRVGIDWGYNAWGGKYPPFDCDNAAAGKMADALQLPRVGGGMILEGGSIEVNGCGDLLTTATCLLNPNRNPHMSREQVDQRLQELLGATNVIWLSGELEGDDTDGHIDNLARFVNPTTIVAVSETDPDDPHFASLASLMESLDAARLSNGEPPQVETLPLPKVLDDRGKRLPASYANFLITNGSVIVPQYRQAKDEVALQTIQRLFPHRRVVGIDCVDVVSGLGAIHCLTQQVPAA